MSPQVKSRTFLKVTAKIAISLKSTEHTLQYLQFYTSQHEIWDSMKTLASFSRVAQPSVNLAVVILNMLG